jgi:hypothetical protein
VVPDYFSCTGYFESFGSRTIGFDFRHVLSPFN